MRFIKNVKIKNNRSVSRYYVIIYHMHNFLQWQSCIVVFTYVYYMYNKKLSKIIESRVPNYGLQISTSRSVNHLTCCHLGTLCSGVKNFKRRLNPVWPRLLCSCTHMATEGVEGSNESYSCCVSTVRRCGGRLSLNSQGEACFHMAPWGGGVIGPSASTDDAHWITNRAILNSNCIGLYPGSTAFSLRFISLAASTGGALNTFLLRYIISHRAW